MKLNIKPQYRPYIIGGAAALILYYLLFRRKPLLPTTEQTAVEQETAQAAATAAPTYPQSQYNTWANQLESAMFDWGTDETTVFAVFKNLKNNSDYLKLFQAFGKREYTGGIAPGFFYPQYDLTQWLREELSESDINTINTDLRNKGITYQI